MKRYPTIAKTVTLPQSLYEQAEKIIEIEDTNFSYVVRDALKLYVARYEGEVKDTLKVDV